MAAWEVDQRVLNFAFAVAIARRKSGKTINELHDQLFGLGAPQNATQLLGGTAPVHQASRMKQRVAMLQQQTELPQAGEEKWFIEVAVQVLKDVQAVSAFPSKDLLPVGDGQSTPLTWLQLVPLFKHEAVKSELQNDIHTTIASLVERIATNTTSAHSKSLVESAVILSSIAWGYTVERFAHAACRILDSTIDLQRLDNVYWLLRGLEALLTDWTSKDIGSEGGDAPAWDQALETLLSMSVPISRRIPLLTSYIWHIGCLVHSKGSS